MAIASPGTTLSDEQQVIGSMVELMKTEQQLLVSADADGLSTLTPTKLQLAQKAAELSRHRHRALGAAGFVPAEAGMEPWLAVGGNDKLRQEWNRLLELARQAKELNRVNGMLVNKQLAHTQGVLNAMRGPASGAANVYGRSGQTMATGPSKRFVVG
jgi:flagella synthesis protein FlgN